MGQFNNDHRTDLLRSLSLGTSGIGIERVDLSKKGSVKARDWTERVIVIEI